jgi:hypothetical protein
MLRYAKGHNHPAFEKTLDASSVCRDLVAAINDEADAALKAIEAPKKLVK